MKHNISKGIFAMSGILVLILDARSALTGAREGIELCLQTVIPSLFPFFVVSILLTSTLGSCTIPLWRRICKLVKIPINSDAILLTSFLGGYPVGAQSVAAAAKRGQLSKEDAERMLAFCNNAGPAFIFGIGMMLFEKAWICWIIWGIHIVSALLIGCLTPAVPTGSTKPLIASSISLTAALRRALEIMALVCGWVILFRVFQTLFSRWFLWLLPQTAQTLFVGILELANGSCDLVQIHPLGLRFLLFSLLLGFGGICVALQTFSVIAQSGLRGQFYLPGKFLHAVLSLLISNGCQWLFPVEARNFLPVSILLVAILIPIICLLFVKKTKFCSSIPPQTVV